MRSLLLLLCLLAGTIQAQDFTTIILVRHAEKDMSASTNDPGLSAAGKERSEALAHALAEMDIDAIFSTPYVRTRTTVSLLSEQKALAIKEYDPFDKEALHTILHDHKGKTLLFSGHSNTVPAMLNTLTQTNDYQILDDQAYDDLFMVIFHDDKPKVIHLQYGAPD